MWLICGILFTLNVLILENKKNQKKFKSMSFENDVINQHGGLCTNQILPQNGCIKLERHCDYQFQSFFDWQEITERHLRA